MPDVADHHDLYALLGIAPDASAEDIKRAYRARARELHPDMQPDAADAPAAFAAVERAYRTLTNPATRKDYDRRRRIAAATDMRRIKTVLPRRPRTAAPPPPVGNDGDIDQLLNLDPVTAANGGQVKTLVPVRETCTTCGGHGAATTPRTCQSCHGRRTAPSEGARILGAPTPCPTCSGAGALTDPCPRCEGNGQTNTVEPILLTLPAGVHNGQRLRITGRGHRGRDGRLGDLYLHVQINA